MPDNTHLTVSRTPFFNRQKIIQRIGSLQVLVVFSLIFLLLALFVPHFLTVLNLTNLVKQTAINLIVASGMVCILILGKIDISAGANLGLSCMLGAFGYNAFGLVGGMLTSIITGALIGLFNGVVTMKGRIPPFITCLGSMNMARGAVYVISGGSTHQIKVPELKRLALGEIFGLPVLLIAVFVVYVIMYFVLHRTKFGQYIFACGSNPTAAKLSGINVDRICILAYVMMGALVGLAAIFSSARVMSIYPDSGTGLEFEVIAGCVIGGVSVTGGEGKMLFTIAGVFVVAFVRNALNLIHINVLWNNFVTGAVILAAVLLDSYRKRLQIRLEQREFMRKDARLL